MSAGAVSVARLMENLAEAGGLKLTVRARSAAGPDRDRRGRQVRSTSTNAVKFTKAARSGWKAPR
jgi:hypothetical protein